MTRDCDGEPCDKIVLILTLNPVFFNNHRKHLSAVHSAVILELCISPAGHHCRLRPSSIRGVPLWPTPTRGAIRQAPSARTGGSAARPVGPPGGGVYSLHGGRENRVAAPGPSGADGDNAPQPITRQRWGSPRHGAPRRPEAPLRHGPALPTTATPAPDPGKKKPPRRWHGPTSRVRTCRGDKGGWGRWGDPQSPPSPHPTAPLFVRQPLPHPDLGRRARRSATAGGLRGQYAPRRPTCACRTCLFHLPADTPCHRGEHKRSRLPSWTPPPAQAAGSVASPGTKPLTLTMQSAPPPAKDRGGEGKTEQRKHTRDQRKKWAPRGRPPPTTTTSTTVPVWGVGNGPRGTSRHALPPATLWLSERHGDYDRLSSPPPPPCGPTSRRPHADEDEEEEEEEEESEEEPPP